MHKSVGLAILFPRQGIVPSTFTGEHYPNLLARLCLIYALTIWIPPLAPRMALIRHAGSIQAQCARMEKGKRHIWDLLVKDHTLFLAFLFTTTL